MLRRSFPNNRRSLGGNWSWSHFSLRFDSGHDCSSRRRSAPNGFFQLRTTGRESPLSVLYWRSVSFSFVPSRDRCSAPDDNESALKDQAETRLPSTTRG